MKSLCYMNREDIDNISNGKISSVHALKSTEDVATFIETFEHVLNSGVASSIIDVVEINSTNYIFLVDDSTKSSFDLYGYINSKYSGNTTVSCVNARLLFPKSKSRGIYTGYEYLECDTGDCDESATGYMDEDALDEIVHGSIFSLVHKANVVIPITTSGVIIGRSKTAQYIIHGNNNVSRKHARVYKRGMECFVENYEPPNGTYINGLRLEPGTSAVLKVGDVLMLADEEFTLELGGK